MSKRYFIIVAVLYLVGCGLGVVFWKSPSLSSAYMAAHKADHERYLKIIRTEAFKRHEERPQLHPLTGEAFEDAEFVEHYRENPEFEHEENRIARYIEFMKIVNSVAFIALLWGAVGSKLTAVLDERIETVRKRFADVEAAEIQAKKIEEASAQKMAAWPEIESSIRKESEETMAQSLAKIKEEDDSARALLDRQEEERRHAELLAAADTIRVELVTEAIRQAEGHYRAQRGEEKLDVNVDRFINLLERMS